MAPIVVRAPPSALAATEAIGSLDIAVIVVFVLVTWAIGWVLAAWLFPARNRWDLADILGSYGLFPVIIFMAIDGAMQTSSSIDSRWHGSCSSGNYFMYLYCSRQILHIPFLLYGEYKPFDKMAMLCHHALSLTCYGSSILSGMRMQFWGSLAGCCEVTTFFLNNLCLLQELHATNTAINAINGVFLWLSFIVFRLVLFPAWLWWWWQETSTHYDKLWGPSNFIERYVFPCVILFLFCLSAKWFVSLTEGMLKATGLRPPSPKKLP
jgi:hypothetical protein